MTLRKTRQMDMYLAIKELSEEHTDYPISEMCRILDVNRAAYYKWKNRGKSSQEKRREEMIGIVQEVHDEHPSHGYRWVHAYILINYKVKCSASFVYTIFRYLGIQSKTKHKKHRRPRKVKDKYPNLIFSTWETVDRRKAGDRVGYDDVQILDILFRGHILL